MGAYTGSVRVSLAHSQEKDYQDRPRQDFVSGGGADKDFRSNEFQDVLVRN